MRFLTLRLLSLGLLLGLTATVSAQVKGISYTISPQAQYNWFDDQAGLDNGFLFGGNLGIGFGEMVELRATYLRDFGLSRNLDGIFDDDIGDLLDRDATLQRYGGEVRLNLGRSTLLPFLTLGTGIQETELDGGRSNENIYASGGLGVTLSVLDRFTLKVEGKNTAYNFNTARNFLTDEEIISTGLDETDFFDERLSNWSLGAGLTVYLGGRRPGQLSEIDQAYNEAFSRGFAGLSLILEPTVSRINFADELAYRDTYLGGASLGLDFGPYVGMRAFYLRSMENGELNLDFDNMTVYGGDFRFRLGTVTNSISPFLTIGGGYINLDDDYVGRPGAETNAVSQPFASGGGGLSLNLSRSFRLVGTYRALLTSGNDIEDVRSPDQIRTSNQWTAGVVIALGKKAERPDVIYSSTAERQLQRQQAEATLEQQAALADQAKKNAEATRQLRQDYELKVYGLQQELEGAYAMADSVKIDSLESAIADTEGVVDELQEREADLSKTASEVETENNILKQQIESELTTPAPATFSAPAPAPNGYFGNANNDRNYNNRNNGNNAPDYSNSRIVLTPAEFQNLVEEIFEGMNAGLPPLPPMPAMDGRSMRREIRIEREIDEETGEERVYRFETDGGEEMNWTGRQPQVRVRTESGKIATEDMQRANADLKADIEALRETIRKMEERQSASETERKAFEEEVKTSLDESMKALMESIQQMNAELKKEASMTDKERKRLQKEQKKN